MAIEASLRDLQRDESKMEQEEGGEEMEMEEMEMEKVGGTSDEQIERAGEYKSDKSGRGRRKVKDTDDDDDVTSVQEKKDSSVRTVKEKKEMMRMEKEKERRRRAEMALMKGCDSPSLEGLTEMDIKRVLIENAKIKSKVGGSESGFDKIRRKSKKVEQSNSGGHGCEEKEKKRKSSSDVCEDPSSSKKRRSSLSRERLLSDSAKKSSTAPKCDIGQVRGVEVGAGGIRSKEGNFERSTQQQQAGEGGGKAESTKSGE